MENENRPKGAEKPNSVNVIEKHNLKKIIEFLETVQFGSVTIIIQNGKIMQIEKNEKIRMT